MQKYPSFCLRQKSPPAGRVSGWAGKAVHVLGLSLIHISEPTRLGMISYAVFCLKKKKKKNTQTYNTCT